jgi:hypothetical protein
MNRLLLVLCFLATEIMASSPAKGASIYFSEEVDLTEKFLHYVALETQSIQMAAHRLSEVKVIEALIKAHRRGVFVEVLVDPVTVTRKTPLMLLLEADIPVHVWRPKEPQKTLAKEGKKKSPVKRMHHYFCLFGKETVWTGSFSFSVKKLFSHRESALILVDEKTFCGFAKEFQQMKKDSSTSLRIFMAEKKGESSCVAKSSQ